MLALAGGAQGSGETFGFTAPLAGVAKAHGFFSAKLIGSSLAWKLSFTGAATAAELSGGTIVVRLCRPCASPAKGTVALTAAQARLLELGKAQARLHTAKGLLSGKVRVDSVTGQGGTTANTTTPANAGPAGTTWAATATALRGQNGNRFEFVCPPDAYAGAGPVWGGGAQYFTDTSAVCPAAVMTGDILLQAGGLVVIEIVPGLSSYLGTTMNGITSQSSGPVPGSFIVIHDS